MGWENWEKSTGKRRTEPCEQRLLSFQIRLKRLTQPRMKDATVLPDRNADSVTSDGATKDGRGALEDYLSLNYITRNNSRSISRGLEYPQNDFSIWTIAKGLGKAESEQDELLQRSSWWKNQWNIDANRTLEDVGDFIGFPAPRNADGTWNTTNYDPAQCLPSCGYVQAHMVLRPK